MPGPRSLLEGLDICGPGLSREGGWVCRGGPDWGSYSRGYTKQGGYQRGGISRGGYVYPPTVHGTWETDTWW